jgi:hypothetical protein
MSRLVKLKTPFWDGQTKHLPIEGGNLLDENTKLPPSAKLIVDGQVMSVDEAEVAEEEEAAAEPRRRARNSTSGD